MKRIIILAVVLFASFTFNAEASRHYNGVGGYFYSQLSPYGSWIEVDYGVIVWRPTIIRVNWMPYQMGRWIWTSDGWYWDSYEPFGFITYHYGRWFFDDYYGWLWYPDYEWAPAWVEWRYDNSYIGWAPLNPYAVFSVNVGIFFTTTYYTPYYHWNYVTYGNFCDPYVYNYYVAYGSKYRIHNGTKYRNNFVYYNGRIQNRGVDVNYVRVHSGKEIKQRDLLRVSDSRELNRDGTVNRDEIRTLDMNRDQLMRNDLGRMEIKRENRKTSVDMEKVQIGRRENVSTETRNDKSKERTLDVTRTDQIRNEVKVGTDKVFNENRNESSGKSNVTVDRKNVNIESTNRENVRTKTKVDTQSKTREISTRNDNQVKQSTTTKTKESVNLNNQKESKTTEVRNNNIKKSSDDQVSKSNVREQSRTQVQTSKNTETKQNTDRTNNNSQDRKRK